MNEKDPLLIDTGRGFSILYKGKSLYSRIDPIESCRRKVSSFTCTEKTLIFIPSPILFYGMDVLLSRIPENCHILCLEADEKLMAVSIKNSDKRFLKQDRITYVRTESIAKFSEILGTIGLWRFRKVQMITISGGYMLNRTKYQQFLERAEKEIQEYWQNRMTIIHMSELWIKNTLLNLPLFLSGSPYEELKTDLPILITGAGVSLEYSLSLIKKIRDRIFIVAVDTSLPVLACSGIQPDLILIVEAQYANLLDFSYHKGSKIPILTDISALPCSLRLFSGKKYFFRSDYAEIELFNRMEEKHLLPDKIPPLGSVGVVSVLLAKKLTGNLILYTGLDFSYLPGKPHAKGCPSHLLTLSDSTRYNPPGLYEASIKRPIFKTKDKFNKSCTTDRILESYRETLKHISSDDGRIIDIGTIGLNSGAKIITDEAQILELLGKSETIKSEKTLNEKSEKESNFSKSELESFLTSEKILLEKLLKTGKDALLGRKTEKELLISLLKETDYLYLHFPDTPPVPYTDHSFIKRVLVSVIRYFNILSHLSLK